MIRRPEDVLLRARRIQHAAHFFDGAAFQRAHDPQDSHRAVPGAQEHPDHPQAADFARAVFAVSVLRIARHAQQPVALPAADRIRSGIHRPRGFADGGGSRRAVRNFSAHPLFQIIGRGFRLGAFFLYQLDVVFCQPNGLRELPRGGGAHERQRGSADPAARPAAVHRQTRQPHLLQMVPGVFAVIVGGPRYGREEAPLLVLPDRIGVHAGGAGDIGGAEDFAILFHVNTCQIGE